MPASGGKLGLNPNLAIARSFVRRLHVGGEFLNVKRLRKNYEKSLNLVLAQVLDS